MLVKNEFSQTSWGCGGGELETGEIISNRFGSFGFCSAVYSEQQTERRSLARLYCFQKCNTIRLKGFSFSSVGAEWHFETLGKRFLLFP